MKNNNRKINLLLNLFLENKIKYKSLSFQQGCKYYSFGFENYSAALKASQILEENDIHHMFYRDSLALEDDVYHVIVSRKNREYNSMAIYEYKMFDFTSALGTRLLQTFDKIYKKGLSSVDPKVIKQINEDVKYLLNVKIIETDLNIDLVTLIDWYFTAGSSLDNYFTSRNINKEIYDYGCFIKCLLDLKTFEDSYAVFKQSKP